MARRYRGSAKRARVYVDDDKSFAPVIQLKTPAKIAQEKAANWLRQEALMNTASIHEKRALLEITQRREAEAVLGADRLEDPIAFGSDSLYAMPDDGDGGSTGMDDDEWEDQDTGIDNLQEVMRGLADSIADDNTVYTHHLTRKDTRTRRDRTERRNQSWATQFPELTKMYLAWRHRKRSTGPEHTTNGLENGEGTYIEGEGEVVILTADLLEYRTRTFINHKNSPVNIVLAENGCIGTSPDNPSRAITFEVLEFYRTMVARCPQLSEQAFVKSMCSIYKIAYSPTLRSQFSIAFDTYCKILEQVNQQLDEVLGRGSPNWHVKNACVVCSKTLQGEAPMNITKQFGLDGNMSLKRVQRVSKEWAADGRVVNIETIKQIDTRTRHDDRFMTESEVNRFANEVKARSAIDNDILPQYRLGPQPAKSSSSAQTASQEDGGTSECATRWVNLADDSTKKAMGFFDQTGIFILACRHGTVLLMCDMIKSGELSKYPLALVDRAIDIFGKDLMIGYNIGCGFAGTVARSPLVGPKAEANTKFCIRSFHGHAHNRMCQLNWHPNYISGSGIEDYEMCERVFSPSNDLARTTRLSSRFYRRQLLKLYFDVWNEEKYSEISRFILNNLRQAFNIIDTLTSVVEDAKDTFGIENDEVFVQWLQEEREYLAEVTEVPSEDHQRREYLRVLKQLVEAEQRHERSLSNWINTGTDVFALPSESQRQRNVAKTIQAERKTSLSVLLTLKDTAGRLEAELGVETRWIPEIDEWQAAQRLDDEWEFQCAIDTLEETVVSRLFELTKLHQSGISYKQRQHILHGLNQRLGTLKSAVTRYNRLASKVDPPRPTITSKQVVDYVHIGEFDLLRQSRHDISAKPWAKPPIRKTINSFFKIQRAHEEITRSTIEASRLLTHIRNEEHNLNEHLKVLEEQGNYLASLLRDRIRLLQDVNRVPLNRICTMQNLDGTEGRIKYSTLVGEEEVVLGNDDPLVHIEDEQDHLSVDENQNLISLDTVIQVLTGTFESGN